MLWCAHFFFCALLIITHRRLHQHQLLVLLFSPPEPHLSSLFLCLSSSNPLRSLSLGSGLARLCFLDERAGGLFGWVGGGGEVVGDDTSLEMKRVTKAYQRAGSSKRLIIIGCCANQTRLHFMQSSSASGQLSFTRLRKETGNRWERRRGRVREQKRETGLELLFCWFARVCLPSLYSKYLEDTEG